MKIEELLYKTPEMSEERLLKLINNKSSFISNKYLKRRILSLHKTSSFAKAILDEWDLIQEKRSYLTKGERDKICTLVSVCLIEMTKNNEENTDKTV